MAALRRDLAQRQVSSAEEELRGLPAALRAVSVDRNLVEAKVKRVEARLGAARARGIDIALLQERAGLALQELLEGRHEAANAQLNAILARLAAR